MSELSDEARAEAQRRHEAGELYDLTKSRLTTFVEGAEWAAARTAAVVAATPDRDQLEEAIRNVLRKGAYAMGEPFEKLPYEWQSKRVADAVLALLGGA